MTSQETPNDAARRLGAGALRDGFKPEGLHSYTDHEGSTTHWRIRMKHPESGRKWIRPMKLNGADYVLGEPAFADGKPLYRLHTLSERSDRPVIVTEGELKADKLAALGLIVTTSGSADSAGAADWRPLARRDVLIWPDNDDAGGRYAETVAAILLRLGCAVRVLDVTALGLVPKGDAADWLALRPEATAADVLALPSRAAMEVHSDKEEGPARDGTSETRMARTAEKAPTRRLIFLNGAEMKPEPIEWLWDGWLAAGKLHILAGAPGTGKTTIAMSLAATLTRAGRWPDGVRAPLGTVVIASYEDDPADTLAPRLLASGADMARIKFLAGVWDGTERKAFSARDDSALLADAIRANGVRLLIVDPIISALGTFDSHRNAETRMALQPLADIAAETGVAIIGIAHFTKGTTGRDPLERVSGSLAFGAVARVVMGAATKRDGDDEEHRLFVRVKSNIGPDSGGFSYELEHKEVAAGVRGSCVAWGNPVEGSARELLAEPDGQDDESSGEDIERFVRESLANGPIPSNVFRKDAEGAGFHWRAVYRAARKMGAESRKEGMKGGWGWGFFDVPKMTYRPENDEGDTSERLSSSSRSTPSLSPSEAIPTSVPSDAEVI